MNLFHQSMIQHRMHNHITKLKTEVGEILEDCADIEQELTGYFHDLLSGLAISIVDVIKKVTQHIPPIITTEQNASLMQPISLQEDELPFNQMIDGTTPGSDGFTINFFHYCWNLLKYGVLKVVE